MRNLAIAVFKLTGTRNIAAACRRHARDATRVLATLGLAPLCPKRTWPHYAETRAMSMGAGNNRKS